MLPDLYQLNMLVAYIDHGLTDIAVFELFVRKLHYAMKASGAVRGSRLCDMVQFDARGSP